MEEHGAAAMFEKNKAIFMNPAGEVVTSGHHGAVEMLAVSPCPVEGGHHWLIPSPHLSSQKAINQLGNQKG